MRRFMISAMSSGSGKTVLACGLMRAFQRRGLSVCGFKSGPDYIDPMFHKSVLGVPSRNLDLFLQGKEGVLRTLDGQEADLAVMEGAMGFYDGKGGTALASAWETAAVTQTPVLLAVRPKGQSLTLAAQIRGMTEFRDPSGIAGLILTDCPAPLFTHLSRILEKETGLPVLGYLPPMEEAKIPSRHLGLVTADEIADLKARFDAVADALAEHVNLDGILRIADTAGARAVRRRAGTAETVCRIAVARDEAFSFYYEENLDELREHGAELVFFSPLHDAELPQADGLYLGGGYPELFPAQLSGNGSMLRSIRGAVTGGMPAVAECGGFLYLQRTLSDREGHAWPMADVLPGEGYATDRLQRFGYLTLLAQEDSLLFRAGEQIPAHEFHYWDTSAPGESLLAQKTQDRTWRCGYTTQTLYAAFPHLHFGGKTPVAERFVRAAARYAGREEKR